MAAYQKKFEPLGDENTIRVESFVFLQIVDRAWKNHLLGMDHLRDSVSLRGYGQRDPLQEYKREAFRLFDTMMSRIYEETTQALLHMDTPQLVSEDSFVAEEPDEDSFQFRHPSAQHQAAAPQPARPSGNDDGMIYHGARLQDEIERPAQAPVKRTDPKVGRNDPCPCGSGKKYKKCHGAIEGAHAAD
jgi:preprotein translocase subunit SecA